VVLEADPAAKLGRQNTLPKQRQAPEPRLKTIFKWASMLRPIQPKGATQWILHFEIRTGFAIACRFNGNYISYSYN
jgi:hypothetical protein